MNEAKINIQIPDVPGLNNQWCARLNALAHPARLEILQYLSAREDCCCKDVVDRLSLAQSTVSQHLKVLIEAGLINTRNEAQRSCYSLNSEALLAISQAVSELVGSCCDSNCCSKD